MNKKTIILLGAALAVIPCACNKNDAPKRPERSEFIKVYETPEKKTVDNIQVPFEGIQDGKIHILSNVDVQDPRYFTDPNDEDTDWFTIKSIEEVEPGHKVVTYDAASLLSLNSLDRRGGKLSIYCPEESLGKYLSVRQGYERRFLETFSGETGGNVTLTGRHTYTTKEYQALAADYVDYLSFNVWAETDNEFLSKNITLDITVSGGLFYATGLKTYRINVPRGAEADQSNFKYLLIVGEGGRLSTQTKFTFSTANDDLVYVHLDNFAAYRVTEAEMLDLFQDEDFIEDEEIDWI